jgi:hypothetical protein
MIFQLPKIEDLVDKQFFQVPVADGILAGYQVDQETKTFYAKESQIIIPSMHGLTHVAEDPVPDATPDLHGLMSGDDKAKLDALVQMRLGILGYQGAGFPDDGGFLTGDIILAAGSEFISIERVGNTVRFTVDSPIPLNCGCESCAQIFWIQDESEARAIRPPSCNGVMPNVSAYGELKIYLLPESTIVDPQDPLTTLNTKGNYPTLIFKRYDNGLTPFEASFEMVLKRNSNLTSNVGWAFTPGPTNIAQLVWYMGSDKNGAQIKFELWPDSEPGLMGQLLYRGNLITKMPAVITGYTTSMLTTNQYNVKKWDLKNEVPVGSAFVAKNVWKYLNPENTTTNTTNPKTLVLDNTVGILPVGTLVDLYQFETARTGLSRTVVSYFIKEPAANSTNLWSLAGAVRFGDRFTAREEINNPSTGSDLAASELNVSDVRLFERGEWGLLGFEDRLILSDDGGIAASTDGVQRREPSGDPINNDIVADIDPTIPGLKVLKQTPDRSSVDVDGDGVVTDKDLAAFACAYGSKIGDANYNVKADLNGDGRVDVRDLAILGQFFDLGVERVTDRPLFLWNRSSHKNVLTHLQLGMPAADARLFPPYDLLLSAPVDSFDDTYVRVIQRGVFQTGPFAGAPYIVVKGIEWRELPQQGILRILTGAFRNIIWRYYFKAAFSSDDDDGVTLIGRDYVFPFDEDFPILNFRGTSCTVPGATDLPATDYNVPTSSICCELLHQDYTAPCMRFQFESDWNTGSEAVQLQIICGMLDMGVAYTLYDPVTHLDDLVRGFSPGYTVSKIMVQQGFITDGIGAGVVSNPTTFKVYWGGELAVPVSGQTEKWNEVEVMYKDNQAWLWWNGILVSPDPTLCSKLPTPVAVNTPYFPLHPQVSTGKVALRMFPGAIVRSFDVKDQLTSFNEYSYSQQGITS